MEDLAPSDLKTILHSKRANLYYLQHCRVLVKGGRVSYVTDEGNRCTLGQLINGFEARCVPPRDSLLHSRLKI